MSYTALSSYTLKLTFLLLALLVVLTVSLAIGRYPINLLNLNEEALSVLLNVRLPRVLMSAIGGAIFGVTGTALQATFKNPLISPYILGITQGAAFGAALALLLFQPVPYVVTLSAFLFSMIALACTLVIAGVQRYYAPLTIVLAGIIVGAIFSSLLSIIQYIIDPWRLQGIVFWLMGGFYRVTWEYFLIALPGSLISLILLTLIRWRLNILSLSDDEARALGINVVFERVLVFVISSLAIASVTAISGIIAFAGLVFPHIARGLIGSDNRVLIPASALVGSLILLVTDDICRSLYTFEIPISILTTLIATPYFIYLMRRITGEWR